MWLTAPVMVNLAAGLRERDVDALAEHCRDRVVGRALGVAALTPEQATQGRSAAHGTLLPTGFARLDEQARLK
jgi:hypothetical protein